jgi:uncharacterized membrane protein
VNYNPYAAPQGSVPPPAPPAGFGPPQPWTAADAVRTAWERFKVHGGMLILAHFAFSAATGIFAQVPNVFVWTHVVDGNTPAFFGLMGGGYMVTQVFSSFFYVGMTRMWLDVARGVAPRFETLFSGADRFLPMLALNLIFGLGVVVGCALFVVPGVLLMAVAQLAPYYVVEGRMGPIEALQKSWESSSGQRGELFVLILAGLGLGVLGFVTCCMGLIVTIPLYWVATAVAFTRVAGMTVAPLPQQGPVQPPYPGPPHNLPPWR